MKSKMVSRAFLFNREGEILLVQHRDKSPWVLPGGHIEDGEDMHSAMQREILEELGLTARFFEIDSEEYLFHKGKQLKNYPLPISIYHLEYTDAKGRERSQMEYIFLMETDDEIDSKNIQKEEIFDYKWFDPDEILAMKPNVETWDFYIQILEKIIDTDDTSYA